MREKRGKWVLLTLFLLLLAGIQLSFLLGRYPIAPKELFGILYARISPAAPAADETMATVLFNIRLPRILLACIVGCAIAAAGACYQGVFRNPMASPDLLGASQGAAFGAALAILLKASSRGITLAAFCASLLTVAMVLFVGQRAPGKKTVNLILAGVMVSSLFSAGTSFIKLVADPSNDLPAITYWLMGSLSGAKLQDLSFVIFPMLLGLLPLFLLRWRINILTLGDDEARAMGVQPKRMRLIVILCSTLVTAAAVSVSGLIGWVGLVIPHLCRKLVGNNYKYLLPASMLGGAFFLLLVDNISRNLLAVEIPIGILTAFVGAPFFLYLITRKESTL